MRTGRPGRASAAPPERPITAAHPASPEQPTTAAHPAPGGAAEPSLPPGLAVRLALFVALLLLLATGTPPRFTVLALILVALLLAASLRWRVGRPAIGLLLLVGVGLRLLPATGFSDVLVVTEAAIREMLAGGSPYGHGFAASVPPGAPFAYGPLALAWYLPSLEEPGRLESAAAFLVLALLAIRGRPLGMAVYAVSPALIVTAADGSNDTTAGLLILLALVMAVRAPVAGAVLLAAAVAFKPYALAWLPGLLAYGGIVWPLVAFLVASLALWLPAVVAWGPGAIIWSWQRADEIHAVPYYSLAYALGDPPFVPRAAWQAGRVAVGVLVAVVGFLAVRSARSFVLAGLLVFGATLFLGWWSTFAYLAAVAPVVCWYLDDWLGLGEQRVTWPGDPVGTLDLRLDRRWPVRHDWRTAATASPPGR